MIEKITLTEKEKQGLFNLGKEPPTTKTVEEVVAEFFDSVGHCISTQSPQNFTNVKNKLTQIFTTQNQAADERLREVVGEIIETIESVHLTVSKKHANDTTLDKAKVINEWLMPEVKRNVSEAVKTIAAKHGITNL